MNGIYPLPINRGHGFWFFHKKNIQVSSVFKRKSVSLLSISQFFFFKSFSVGFYVFKISSADFLLSLSS